MLQNYVSSKDVQYMYIVNSTPSYEKDSIKGALIVQGLG